MGLLDRGGRLMGCGAMTSLPSAPVASGQCQMSACCAWLGDEVLCRASALRAALVLLLLLLQLLLQLQSLCLQVDLHLHLHLLRLRFQLLPVRQVLLLLCSCARKDEQDCRFAPVRLSPDPRQRAKIQTPQKTSTHCVQWCESAENQTCRL